MLLILWALGYIETGRSVPDPPTSQNFFKTDNSPLVLNRYLKRTRWFLARAWRPAAIAATLVTLVILGVRLGLQEPPVDTQVYEVNKQSDDDEGRGEISRERYLRAIDLEKAGKLSAARVEMRWLAPLGRVGSMRGIPDAHLWMAKDLLDGFDAGFLAKFPLGAEDDNLKTPVIDVEDGQLEDALRHLDKALELRQDYTEALLYRAALLIAQSDRESAIAGLIDGAAVIDEPSRLVFPLIHAIAYEGDEVGLREQLWAGYSTLGNEISRSRRVESKDRIRYALFALLRGEYEGFEISLNRLESSESRDKDNDIHLAGLKAAPYYHRAVLELLDSDGFSPSETAANLGKCLEIAEGEQSAASALAALVEKYPNLKQEVSKFLDEKDVGEAVALLDVVLSGGDSPGLVATLKRIHLEAPSDPVALLRWANAAIAAEESDPDVLVQLEQYVKANRTVTSQEDVAIRIAYARCLLANDDVVSAVSALEGALQENKNTKEVRALLADAYRRLGLSAEAKLYESMSD